MEPEDILTMLRRYGALIMAHVCIGALLGVVLAALSAPVYTSHASAFVAAGDSEGTQSVSNANILNAVMPSLVELGTSDQILQSVSTSTGVPVSGLRGNVAVSAGESSLIITVAASAPSPEAAQSVAAAEIQALRERMSTMSVKVQDQERTLTLTDVDVANLPAEPSAPSRSRYALYGAILGCAVGGALALVLFRSSSLRSGSTPAPDDDDDPVLDYTDEREDADPPVEGRRSRRRRDIHGSDHDRAGSRRRDRR